MRVAVIGMSHHTAPVEVRERIAFGPAEAAIALTELRNEAGVEEAVLLSTCNRTEVYLFPAAGSPPIEAVGRLLGRKAERTGDSIRPFLFEYRGEAAVRHLFEVASGLDSMVTGEAEIQGQVREAYERSAAVALEPPMTGPVLNRLFQMALAVGGQVRAETAIGEGRASVASAAVELARKIFGQLKGKRVLVLGAGATGELMVEALQREGVEGIIVANRTFERATELATRLRGHAVNFDRLPDVLASADIVLASTAAPHHVLRHETFREAFPDGARRPLLIIDIAIPRDVDPALGDEPEVFLYNVDDLRRIVDDTVRVRKEAVPMARGLIDAHTRDFRAWYASVEVAPVIRTMRERAEHYRRSELNRLYRGLDHLNENDRARVEEFSRRLLNKVLHDPTVQLRRGLGGNEGEGLINAVRFLYGVGEGDAPSPPPASDAPPCRTERIQNGEESE